MWGPSHILTGSCLFDDSCWSFESVFSHITRGHFWENSHRKNILCSHLGQNHSESRTVATWRAPPIIDSHDFWWFSDSLGTSPKQKLLGNSTWIAKPAIFKKPLGAPSRVWLHHSNLELQLGMVASISFYLEKGPWKPWPPWKKPVAKKKKFILASPKKGEANIWTCETIFFFFSQHENSLWKEHESTRLV